jgi:hypothetical protein
MIVGANQFRYGPPACIADFDLLPIPAEGQNDNRTAFALRCKCGSRRGSVLGYPLRSVRGDYLGPELFVSPLAFFCSSCGKTTEIIDTEIHGYHPALKIYLGESTQPVNLRGAGDREPFRCPKCDGTETEVIVEFGYSGAERDIEEDSQTGHIEEFFLGFYAHGACARCGEKVIIAEFHHL